MTDEQKISRYENTLRAIEDLCNNAPNIDKNANPLATKGIEDAAAHHFGLIWQECKAALKLADGGAA